MVQGQVREGIGRNWVAINLTSGKSIPVIKYISQHANPWFLPRLK